MNNINSNPSLSAEILKISDLKSQIADFFIQIETERDRIIK